MSKNINYFFLMAFLFPTSVTAEVVPTGKTINTTNGNTVSKFGHNMLVDSDGVRYQRFGNELKDSNGYSWRIFGNKIKRSDGKTCSFFGNGIKCSPSVQKKVINE